MRDRKVCGRKKSELGEKKRRDVENLGEAFGKGERMGRRNK